MERSTVPWRRRVIRLGAAVALVVVVPVGRGAPLAAQDTARVADSAVVADTGRDSVGVVSDTVPIAPEADTILARVPDSLGKFRVTPSAALWRSLAVPGWGQLKLGSEIAAGFFIAAEALTLGMTLKTNGELRDLRRSGADSAAIAAKTRQREDWIVFLVLNHLVSGLEAFVAANLSDFPAELEVRQAPGWTGVGVRVPVRFP